MRSKYSHLSEESNAVYDISISGILHDPKLYEDPMEFRPERFISSDTHQPEKDPRDIIFGFGRRSADIVH